MSLKSSLPATSHVLTSSYIYPPHLVFKDLRTVAFSSPGLIKVGTSGTTISDPVIWILSPALHFSVQSSLTMTSMVCGMDPAGTSCSFSCKRTRCQSPHRVERLSASRLQFVVLPQFFVGHFGGVVTLNSCDTPLISRRHSLHFHVATKSSGLISVVRVTVPQIVTSLALARQAGVSLMLPQRVLKKYVCFIRYR